LLFKDAAPPRRDLTSALALALPDWLGKQGDKWRGSGLDVKLLFIGEGNVGKTSLLRQLAGAQEEGGRTARRAAALPNVATDGIDIVPWARPAGRPSFRAWDFAGQRDYLLTHQYFLTGRAVYLVVFNAALRTPMLQPT
jgi:GTPase SAR1 family protein